MEKMEKELITNSLSDLKMNYYAAISKMSIAECGMIELMKDLLKECKEVKFYTYDAMDVRMHDYTLITVNTITLTDEGKVILNNNLKCRFDDVFGGHKIWLLQAVMETRRIPLFPHYPKDNGIKEVESASEPLE